MPRSSSLRRSGDFKNVFSTGARARVDGVTVFMLQRPDAGPVRLGLAVPAGSGGAVTRNRIRRRLRAAFDECDERMGMDVALRATREVAQVPFQELVNHLESALQKAEGTSR